MKLHPEDPRLTAFALGELAPDEAAAVENAIAEDPLLRAELAELRGLTTYLTAGLHPPAEKLTPEQHEAVMRSIVGPPQSGVSGAFTRIRDFVQPLFIPAAAAAVLGVATVILMRMPSDKPVAMDTPAAPPEKKDTVATTPVAPVIEGTPTTGSRSGPSLAAQFPSMELPVQSGTKGLERISKTILEDHKPPPKDAVHLEEILNHFSYKLNGVTAIAPKPATWHPDERELTPGTHAATLSSEMIPCAWKPSAMLLLVSLHGNPSVDCEVTLTFHADPTNVARYRLLGFEPVTGTRNAEFPKRLKAGSTTTLAIELEPSGSGGAFGSIEWSTDGRAAPLIVLTRKPDAEPSDDARFAALICTYAQWLRGEQSGLIDADIVAALAREIAAAGLPPDRAEFLALVDASLHR